VLAHPPKVCGQSAAACNGDTKEIIDDFKHALLDHGSRENLEAQIETEEDFAHV
jgi:hypothetical protein